MKKNGRIKRTKKAVYEENPWDDDEPVLGRTVKDFLPPPHILKKAKVRILHDVKEISLELKDHEKLKKQAAKVGISPAALMSAVISDYLRGHSKKP